LLVRGQGCIAPQCGRGGEYGAANIKKRDYNIPEIRGAQCAGGTRRMIIFRISLKYDGICEGIAAASGVVVGQFE
jgi:hypothetical protein